MKQKFAYSRISDPRWKPGFRTYFQDRDLGVKQATAGRYTAEIHRACGPCPDQGSGVHHHAVDFQFNYVLRGWIRVWIEGQGELTFNAGDSWTQPPSIRHNVLGFSDDFEVLEIVSPGEFETREG